MAKSAAVHSGACDVLMCALTPENSRIIEDLTLLEIFCVLTYPTPLQGKKRGPAAAIMSLAKRPRVESTEETSQSRSIFQFLES